MKEITKIIIKGCSGYGPGDEAYEDQIIIRPDSIAYKYHRNHAESEGENVRWRYKSDSENFKAWYQIVCRETEEQLNMEDADYYTDVGGVDIIAVYADKTKRKDYFCVPSAYFADYFRLIKQMVPSGEVVPYVLMTGEDYGDSHRIDEGKYRHYKGKEYEVIGMARNSETELDMVIYRALYGDGSTWVRPAAMWNETVHRNGKSYQRFTKLEDV